ncbi:DUF6086 family protein [Streptomyces djakartensis]|uniref:Roadblock/LAMTOR2 domain-containing protein n=1 Tax=Streptomyces djakartensis TaxID=68193 RepID=A0ABQ2ZY80_9ACTN|nr:DUF6086 family protein [Streptomyces djakartensis]GGY26953.1 hypothetical protein GCM10010384_37560 [Streptomyces djakartensis]
MSYPFEYGDETLWDAGYHSGQLYASLVRGAAGFLDVPSGLTQTPQGGCAVDREAFQAFVQQLYDLYASTSNEVLRGLAQGLLGTSLVLLDRAGGAVALRPEDATALREAASALGRAMAS